VRKWAKMKMNAVHGLAMAISMIENGISVAE